MSRPVSTRLRWASFKSDDELTAYVNSLPYMIEIKSIIPFGKKGVKIYFVLPDNIDEKSEIRYGKF